MDEVKRGQMWAILFRSLELYEKDSGLERGIMESMDDCLCLRLPLVKDFLS